MHVLHFRGGSKASWARLNRDQDLNHLGQKSPEAEEFDRELLDI